MSEKIWYDDLPGFLTPENYYVILPVPNMSFEEKVNALVRFFIYFGIILSLIKSDYKYMMFGIIAAIISVVVVEFEHSQRQKAERFLQDQDLAVVDNTMCVRSTVDNPFMNPTIADITYNPTRPKACNTSNPCIQNQIDKNFNARLYRDVSDLYGNMSSQREFYTVPSTTIPNDQSGFAEWLYGSGPTCKEGNGMECKEKTFRMPM